MKKIVIAILAASTMFGSCAVFAETDDTSANADVVVDTAKDIDSEMMVDEEVVSRFDKLFENILKNPHRMHRR